MAHCPLCDSRYILFMAKNTFNIKDLLFLIDILLKSYLLIFCSQYRLELSSFLQIFKVLILLLFCVLVFFFELIRLLSIGKSAVIISCVLSSVLSDMLFPLNTRQISNIGRHEPKIYQIWLLFVSTMDPRIKVFNQLPVDARVTTQVDCP